MTGVSEKPQGPTPSELKAEAMKLEEVGSVAEAVAVYESLLRMFERDPEAVDDAPAIYRVVGDLRLQLHQPSRAFASYQQAAEHYARAGSASEIKDLCVRMINVVPAAGDVYARYARRLHEHGHSDAALMVLTEYAEKASVDSVTEAVRAIGRSEAAKASRVIDLLNTIDDDSESQMLAAGAVTRELLEEAGGSDAVSASARMAAAQPAKKQSRPETPKTVSTPVSGERKATRSTPITSTRVWGGEARSASTRPDTPANRNIKWVYASGFVGVAAIVVLLVVVSTGNRTGASGDAAPLPPVAATNDSGLANAAGGPPDQVAESRQSPVTGSPADQTSPPTPAAQTEAEPPDVGQSAPAVSGDSIATLTEPIVVQNLTVENVSPSQFRGLQGFRVVHLLDSIAEFIVESYPVDSSSANAYPLGTVIVNVVPPDTAVSIVRFDERHLVFASGVVPEDSMRVLLGRLAVQGGN